MYNLFLIIGHNKEQAEEYAKSLKDRLQKDKSITIMFPEVCKHPKEHIELVKTDILPKLETNNLILVTMSDFIVRELNNLICIHSGKSIGVSMGSYHDEISLSHKLVSGVEVSSNGSEELVVTEMGIEVPSFEDVISSTNARQEDILYTYDPSLFED